MRLSRTLNKKKSELLSLQDKLGELYGIGVDQVDVNSDDNPQMRTIRMLENKLDKAMIKYNEAQSIRKTYEMIVKRLKDERVGYDNQLAAIEQSLKGKEHDYEELLLLSYDAKHAQEVAEAELRKFESEIQEKRKVRDDEVSKQRKEVQQRIENKTKIDEKAKENHDQKLENMKKEHDNARMQDINKKIIGQETIDKEKRDLLKFDKAMRRIKDATGVSDINEIIQKFVTQNDTLRNLNSQKEEFERKILELNDEKYDVKRKLEKVKYEGVESMTRKQIDEVEINVGEAQRRLDRNKDIAERANKVIIDCKAGIEHLGDKIIDFKLEDEPNIIITDDTLVESLMQIEKKCSNLLNEIKSEDLYDEVMARIKGLRFDKTKQEPMFKKIEYDVPSLEPTKNNVRVRIPEKEDDDLSDIDIDAEAEAEINERMKIKVEAHLRYDRMAKNKLKKGKGSSNGKSKV